MREKRGNTQMPYFFDRETKENYLTGEERTILPRISREFESFQR